MSSANYIFLKNILFVLLIGIIIGAGIGVLFTPYEHLEYLGNAAIMTTEISHFVYIVNVLKVSFISSFILTISYLLYKFYPKK